MDITVLDRVPPFGGVMHAGADNNAVAAPQMIWASPNDIVSADADTNEKIRRSLTF